jgi:hypothetical protein
VDAPEKLDAPLLPLAPGSHPAYIEPAPGHKIVSVAFDTLKFARALQGKAKLTTEQAEGIAEAFAEATGEQLAIKADLRDLGADLRAEVVRQGARISDTLAAHDSRFVKIEGELALLKWMVGFNLAATVGVVFLLLRH